MINLKRLQDVFSLQEALKQGLTPYALAKLINESKIERVRRGVYKKSDSSDLGEWTTFITASKSIPQKNAICLLSALAFHNLTEVIPTTVWLLVDSHVRTSKPGVSLLRRRDPQWGIGFIEEAPLLITDIERTLIDCLVFKEKIGYNETFFAIKKALNKKNHVTTLHRILTRAKELGSLNQVKSKLEPFIYE